MKNPVNRYRHKPARVALGVSMGEARLGARAKPRPSKTRASVKDQGQGSNKARLVCCNVALKNVEKEG